MDEVKLNDMKAKGIEVMNQAKANAPTLVSGIAAVFAFLAWRAIKSIRNN